MTVRECYKRIAKFEKTPYIPNFDNGPFPRTMRQWRKEGMPADVSFEQFFGTDRMEFITDISYAPDPGVKGHFESPDYYQAMLAPHGYEVLFNKANAMVARREGRDYHIGQTSWGSVNLFPVDSSEDDLAEGAFIHVRDALQTREEWEAIKDDFRPDIDVRYGEDKAPGRWAKRVAEWKKAEHPLILWGPSMVGELVQFMGMENYGVKLYDDREMIAEIMDARVDVAIGILEKAISEVGFDMLFIWEDMAFRNGPMVGPAIFKELIVPRYKRLTEWYRSRGGQIVALDSDGDVRTLIPGWIKGGITHLWPFEVFAGMDVVEVRRKYGHAFSMRGGIDKFVVAKGKEAIDRELDRVWPVVQDGGYIPHLDHMMPHASFENYCYYMEKKKQMLGKR